MLKQKLHFLLTSVLLLGAIEPAVAQTVASATQESVDKLVAVLQSDADHKAKADACRQLAVVGNKTAVASLAALLTDPKFSHMARYGLETIPDPSVDAAFRQALGALKGLPLVGVIGSIGVRRDAQAVPALVKLLKDADADVAQAAARSLGSIGTLEAGQAIQAALAGVPEKNQVAFCEGLFRCAERMAEQGKRSEALAIYDHLRTVESAPKQVRVGALRGAVLTRGKDGLPLLRETIRQGDYVLFPAAIGTAQEYAGDEVIQMLAVELPELPVYKQIAVIRTLGIRGNPAALAALSKAAQKGDPAARVVAIQAMSRIADAAAVPALVTLMTDENGDVAKAAQESLASLPGQEVDAAIMAMLAGKVTAERLTAIELVGRRRIVKAVPALLAAAKDKDAKIQSSALRQIGELGSAQELPNLINLLLESKDGRAMDAAEQALILVASKAGDTEASSQQLIAAWSKAQTDQKGALLRVLTALGGTSALEAVREGLKDSTPEVRTAAIRSLSAWKTADAAPDLLNLIKSAANATERTLSLRGYLSLASNSEIPVGKRLAMCREAVDLVQSTEEKRLLLSALGQINTPQSVALIGNYMGQAETKEEACAATLAIAERLLKGKQADKVAANLVGPLEKASQSTGNPDQAKRARDLLKQAQDKAGAQ